MIAALFVETGGTYYGLDDVEPWDLDRDARRYACPWPVVAHPPCNRWSQLAPVNAARWGYLVGDDGGTFAAALAAVRRWGGVLEHPARSIAWDRYRLPRPTRGGWTSALDDPGITTEIWQSAYGCPAAKATWLYAVGVEPVALDWRRGAAVTARIGDLHPNERRGNALPRLRRAAASRTPPALRDALLSLARSAQLGVLAEVPLGASVEPLKRRDAVDAQRLADARPRHALPAQVRHPHRQ